MHTIEHKPTQEEPSSLSEQKGTMKTERQKLPRACVQSTNSGRYYRRYRSNR